MSTKLSPQTYQLAECLHHFKAAQTHLIVLCNSTRIVSTTKRHAKNDAEPDNSEH